MHHMHSGKAQQRDHETIAKGLCNKKNCKEENLQKVSATTLIQGLTLFSPPFFLLDV
jgi:hypothetical protein